MRSGEFTCPSLDTFHEDMLSPRDVSLDSRQSPSRLSVRLRRSKADPFGRGVTIYLGRTYHAVCPVTAGLSYLAVRRGPTMAPLFMFSDGSPLGRDKLVSAVRTALEVAGVDHTLLASVTGHSFRIGAATAAAQAGLEDSVIQTLGRWRSSAYQRYIRIPADSLASSSARLIGTLRAQH